MGADQLATRMICSSGNVDSNRLRTGTMTEEDWNRFTIAVGKLSRTKIFIDDTPGIRITDLRSKCRRLKQEHGLDMIVIDYLQLIQGSGSRFSDNRQQEVSEISRTLKAIARELECPVIALSQLSRGVEQRQDKRPMMSDIRESGSLSKTQILLRSCIVMIIIIEAMVKKMTIVRSSNLNPMTIMVRLKLLLPNNVTARQAQ